MALPYTILLPCLFLFIVDAVTCSSNKDEACADKHALAQDMLDADKAGIELLQVSSSGQRQARTVSMNSHELQEESQDEEEEDAAEESEDDAKDADELAEKEDPAENYPMGKQTTSGKYCKKVRRGTSCYSPRAWIKENKTLEDCNNMCASRDACKFFFYGNGHCGLCKSCKHKGVRDGYNIYAKYSIDFPVKNANCKEGHSSQKRMRKERGCKIRGKNQGAVAFSYKKKSKQCRIWKKCSWTRKAKGWVLKKVR